MWCIGCCASLCGGDDDEAVIQKLEIERTDIESVDTIFESAADPFNKTVDAVVNFQSSVKAFKTTAGSRSGTSLKTTLINLKRIYPNLELQVGKGLNFTLIPGTAKVSTAQTQEKAVKLTEQFAAIGDLATEVVDLAGAAAKDAENIIGEVAGLRQTIKQEDLDIMEIYKATRVVLRNISQFRQVPDIELKMFDLIHDFAEQVREARDLIGVNPQQQQAPSLTQLEEGDPAPSAEPAAQDTTQAKTTEATEKTKLIE